MTKTMDDILHPTQASSNDPDFPHAPEAWARDSASALAKEEGLKLVDDHWNVVRALQGYFARVDTPNVRELHDALEERFHAQGGIKYLYQLFPGGPVAQGCRVAGLNPPAGAADKGFGSVQ